MKHLSTIALAATAISAASLATAADVPGRRPAVAPAPVYSAPPPVFTWTGFYVGLNAGYGFSGKNRATVTGNALDLAQGANLPRSYGLKRNGFVGGGQVGYNIQSGSFVGGLEADADFAGGSNKSQTVVAPNGTGVAKHQLGAFGTLRGRAGFLVTDRWLAYGTAGGILASTKFSNTLTGAGALAGDTWAGSNNKTKAGWVIGAGTEYALTNNITAKLEYLYYDLGKSNLKAAPTNPGATATGIVPALKVSNNGSLLRTGVNFKF